MAKIDKPCSLNKTSFTIMFYHFKYTALYILLRINTSKNTFLQLWVSLSFQRVWIWKAFLLLEIFLNQDLSPFSSLLGEKKNICPVSIYEHSNFSCYGATDELKSSARDRVSLSVQCLHSLACNLFFFLSFPYRLIQDFVFLLSFLFSLFIFNLSSHSNVSLPRSRSFSPLTLLSIDSWNTDYRVTFCFVLWQTPQGEPFQDVSRRSNTPTLSLS